MSAEDAARPGDSRATCTASSPRPSWPLSRREAFSADPAAVLVTFLALLGNAAGPQPHAGFGGAEHPARLFAVLVGDAATARKGTALGAVEKLFAEADPDWAEGRIAYGLQSAEAMIDMVD